MNPEMQPRPADEKFDFSDVDAEMGGKKPEAEEPKGEVIYDADEEKAVDMTDEAVDVTDEPSDDVKASLEKIKETEKQRQAEAEEAEWNEKIRAAKELDSSMQELRQIEEDRQAEEAAAVDMTDEAELIEEAAPPPIPKEKSETERSMEEIKALEAERLAQEETGRQEALKAIKEAGELRSSEAKAQTAKKNPIDPASKAKIPGLEAQNAAIAGNELEKGFLDQGDQESAAAETGQDLDAWRTEDKTGGVQRVSKERMPEPVEEPSIEDPEWLKQTSAEAQERIDDLEDVEQKLQKALKKEFGIADANLHGGEAVVSPWKRLKLGWRRLTNRDFRETWDQYQRVSNERSELKALVADISDQLDHPEAWKADQIKKQYQHLSRGVSQSGGRPPSGYIGNKG